jgi:transposase-like protein
VRWYLSYKLSLRDLVEIMAKRGLSLAHTTIMRRVKRFTPEFVKRWDGFAKSAGRSWSVDETGSGANERADSLSACVELRTAGRERA